MRYHVTIGGRARIVDAEPKGGTLYQVAIDGGEPRLVDAAQVEPQVLSVLLGSQSRDVMIDHDGDSVTAQILGTTFEMEIIDDRRQRLRSSMGGSVVTGPVLIRAPMPGKIVKLLVAVGQDVAENQGLVLIEAMKMENELRSPKAGRVESIKVVEGQTVESRAELLSVV